MEVPAISSLRGLRYDQLAGLILVSLSFVYVLRGFINPLSEIPGPWYSRWTNLVLAYHNVRGKGPVYVQRLHEKYGPVVRISSYQVDVSDGESAKQIHRVKADYLKTSFYGGGPKNKINIFNTRDVAVHSRHRKLLSQPLSERGLKDMVPQVEAKARLAVEKMSEEMKLRGAADVCNWWMFFTTDVIGQLSFGDSFRMLESGKKNTYIEDLERVGLSIVLSAAFPKPIFHLLLLLPVPLLKAMREGDERMTASAKDLLQKYRNHVTNEPNPRPMLFTKIMKGETDGETISQEEIVGDAELFIIAGSDTTSTTLTYLTWAVCRNPEIRARLVKEVEGLKDDFTDDDVKNLPYLNMCITETLRRYPVAPTALPRYVPKEGTMMNGVCLPGGSVVTTHNWCLHMNKEVYPEPELFDPLRWETPTKQMKDHFMPFSHGSRNCIGMHLAQIELRLGIAHFFRAFPKATVSTLEGMQDKDMDQLLYFVSSPASHRCLINEC
ncbi:cytochrome P450 [Xylariaceae sp. FL0016]|nr:cytochrome P450 [Xylariaceae sp. FL0016]